MTILVTGAAGFIGYHVSARLLAEGRRVIGIDNLNSYYDVRLKEARLAELAGKPGFSFQRLDLANREGMAALFKTHFDGVVHLGAQAGVRYSLENPGAYADSNLTGFLTVLEGCRQGQVPHCVFASSSSVYGANTATPFRVTDTVDHPLSFYAATKKAGELMAHSYAHLYRRPMTGLRFFTVYGPWGRPDMAPFLFTEKILAGEPIEVFNNGHHARDFTYIDDVVDGVVAALDHVATPNPAWSGAAPDPATSTAPYRIYNIGNSRPVPLLEFIKAIEQATGREATLIMRPMQPGDVAETAADVSNLARDMGFVPKVTIFDGMARFVGWYRDYYGV